MSVRQRAAQRTLQVAIAWREGRRGLGDVESRKVRREKRRNHQDQERELRLTQ